VGAVWRGRAGPHDDRRAGARRRTGGRAGARAGTRVELHVAGARVRARVRLNAGRVRAKGEMAYTRLATNIRVTCDDNME